MSVQIKRIYDAADASDGRRILVDRIWPRGVSKEQAQLSCWMKEIAPSAALRNWFGHAPEKFAEFRRRYEAELAAREAQARLRQLRRWALEERVTLLYAARDERHNQAVVLKDVLARSD